jgi:predicted membrane protein
MNRGRLIAGVIIIAIGLSALVGLSLFKFLIALLIIAIGVRILSGGGRHGDWKGYTATASTEDNLNEVAIFSPLYKDVSSNNFKGGSVSMIFAGGKIDLSKVKTEARAVDLEFSAVFGGMKLVIPKDWTVNSKSSAIFGGINDQTEKGEGKVTLNLRGSVVFGGIEIVN